MNSSNISSISPKTGMRFCFGCNAMKNEASEFNDLNKLRYQSHCKACLKLDMQVCEACKVNKTVRCFSTSSSTENGIKRRCKQCNKYKLSSSSSSSGKRNDPSEDNNEGDLEETSAAARISNDTIDLTAEENDAVKTTQPKKNLDEMKQKKEQPPSSYALSNKRKKVVSESPPDSKHDDYLLESVQHGLDCYTYRLTRDDILMLRTLQLGYLNPLTREGTQVVLDATPGVTIVRASDLLVYLSAEEYRYGYYKLHRTLTATRQCYLCNESSMFQYRLITLNKAGVWGMKMENFCLRCAIIAASTCALYNHAEADLTASPIYRISFLRARELDMRKAQRVREERDWLVIDLREGDDLNWVRRLRVEVDEKSQSEELLSFTEDAPVVRARKATLLQCRTLNQKEFECLQCGENMNHVFFLRCGAGAYCAEHPYCQRCAVMLSFAVKRHACYLEGCTSREIGLPSGEGEGIPRELEKLNHVSPEKEEVSKEEEARHLSVVKRYVESRKNATAEFKISSDASVSTLVDFLKQVEMDEEAKQVAIAIVRGTKCNLVWLARQFERADRHEERFKQRLRGLFVPEKGEGIGVCSLDIFVDALLRSGLLL